MQKLPYLQRGKCPDKVLCSQFCWVGHDDLSHRETKSGYESSSFPVAPGTWEPFTQYMSSESLLQEEEREREKEEKDKKRVAISACQNLRFYGGKALVMNPIRNEKFSIITHIVEKFL